MTTCGFREHIPKKCIYPTVNNTITINNYFIYITLNAKNIPSNACVEISHT